MKQFWKKGIVLILTLAIFMMPFSAGINTNDNGQLAVKVEKNEVRAQETGKLSNTNVQLSVKNNTVSVKITTPKGSIPTSDGVKTLQIEIFLAGFNQPPNGSLPYDKGAKIITKDIIYDIQTGGQTYIKNYSLGSDNYKYGYVVRIVIAKQTLTTPSVETITKNYFIKRIEISQKGEIIGGSTNIINRGKSNSFFDCSWLPTSDWTCKIADALYYVVFVPISLFTYIAAQILDFFVYYSIKSTSYDGEFINTAWGAVRDISNIFFIIALLYVAIKTVLNLNVTNNKKLIGAIIVVALVINFSLFTTKVIIDGSNILTRVFYNNITSKDANGETLKANKEGQKSISVGLVDQFDPQTIFKDTFKGNEGSFIFVTLLSVLLMGFLIYIFISIAILFVSRVISLWLAMIFSPIAFVSYTVPFDIPGFGHKGWWNELLKNAFLAPIFVFFLYIIFLFGDAMKTLPYDINNTGSGITGLFDAAMKVIIPFMIVFILLLKAKKLTIMYSGEMGKALMTGAKMVGGLALGAATGGVSKLGQATAGRVATNMAGKEGFQKFAAKSKFGAGMLKMTDKIGSGSFDIRRTSVGGAFAKASGMNLESSKAIGLGSKEGGYAKARADSVKRKEEFANKLLDTSDYGKAELTRGGMKNKKANSIEKQLIRGGMDAVTAAGHKVALQGDGIDIKHLSEVTRHLDAGKREVFADRLDKRTIPTFMGNFYGKAKRTSTKKRISANKIRKSATSLKKQQDMAAAMVAWAKAGSGTAGSGTAGGGTAGGGTASSGTAKP